MTEKDKWYRIPRSLQTEQTNTAAIGIIPDLAEWVNVMNEPDLRVRVWQGCMINFMDEAIKAIFVLKFGSLDDCR